MSATTHLDAGLLISTDHVLVRPEWPTLPLASVQVEHWAGLFQEVRIAWEDPVPIAPRTQGVVDEHPPNAAARHSDGVGRESVGDFHTEFAEAVATQRHVALGGKFARQRHDQGTRGGGEDRWSAAARAIVEASTALDQETGSPTPNGGAAHTFLLGQGAAPQPGRAAQDQSGSTGQTLWCRTRPLPGGQLVEFSGCQLDCGGGSRHRRRTSWPPTVAGYRVVPVGLG